MAMKTARKVAQQTRSSIPDFASTAEEAAFWDTHDTSDFEDEFKPVNVRFAERLSEGLTIRFDPDTLARLRAQAKKKGMGPTTLARMWILEQLDDG